MRIYRDLNITTYIWWQYNKNQTLIIDRYLMHEDINYSIHIKRLYLLKTHSGKLDHIYYSYPCSILFTQPI
jgi:hypothetical protein